MRIEIHTLPPCAVSVCGLLCTRVPGVAPLVHSQINHFFAKIYLILRDSAHGGCLGCAVNLFTRAGTVYDMCAGVRRIRRVLRLRLDVGGRHLCKTAYRAGSTAYGLLQLARPVPYAAPPTRYRLREPTATLHATRYGLTPRPYTVAESGTRQTARRDSRVPCSRADF